MRIFPIILSGGAGTRLWPLSRSLYPKQFLNLGNEEESLLEATLKRLPKEQGFDAPVILCNHHHRFLVAHAAASAGVEPAAMVLEPVARNTAPAIAVAALAMVKEDPNAILVVMPSDHIIQDAKGFQHAVRKAAEVASEGRLVLFGIPPESPHTGYGYIHRGGALKGFDEIAFSVDSFREKPDEETAKGYLADGGYFWNSGIFVLHAKTFLDELKGFNPEVVTAAEAALDGATPDLDFLRLGEEAFGESPSISIDYAVMEKTSKAAVLPVDIGWSDVGSWSSLWEIGKGDEQGNVTAGLAAQPGQAVMVDTKNTYVHSTRGLVATIGLDNVVIVETPDALLVSDKARSQDVGKIVQQLRADGKTQHEQHLRNHRPWGFFEQLNIGDRFQVKLLHVNPGAELSLQMHHHRSEHWVVVRGTALVTIGEEKKFVRENESVYIVATQWHQLANPGKVPMEIIEVQLGSYLGEDDIMRKNDIYQRRDDETK